MRLPGRGRKRARSVSRLRGQQSVQLTSLMDILTVLIIFLLTTVAAGGDSVSPPPGVLLPASSAADPPPASIAVAIGDGAILLGTERVATIEEVMAAETPLIQGLDARLKEARHKQEAIAALRDGASVPASTATPVTIQGDRKIEFKVLERVMYTLQANGYMDIALAVVHQRPGVGS